MRVKEPFESVAFDSQPSKTLARAPAVATAVSAPPRPSKFVVAKPDVVRIEPVANWIADCVASVTTESAPRVPKIEAAEEPVPTASSDATPTA